VALIYNGLRDEWVYNNIKAIYEGKASKTSLTFINDLKTSLDIGSTTKAAGMALTAFSTTKRR
jgi:hypothetical protein